jgi:hypothetical protein
MTSPTAAPPVIEPRDETVATSLTVSELGQVDMVWPIRGFRNRSAYIRELILQDVRAALESAAA